MCVGYAAVHVPQRAFVNSPDDLVSHYTHTGVKCFFLQRIAKIAKWPLIWEVVWHLISRNDKQGAVQLKTMPYNWIWRYIHTWEVEEPMKWSNLSICMARNLIPMHSCKWPWLSCQRVRSSGGCLLWSGWLLFIHRVPFPCHVCFSILSFIGITMVRRPSPLIIMVVFILLHMNAPIME